MIQMTALFETGRTTFVIAQPRPFESADQIPVLEGGRLSSEYAQLC